MWHQWQLKSGIGRYGHERHQPKGPAPPAAVASASKVAFSALGALAREAFVPEVHERVPGTLAPVDTADIALMERSQSGTWYIPDFEDSRPFREEATLSPVTALQSSAIVPSQTTDDPVRRKMNVRWLRIHFKALTELGRLPFDKADLWQLRQHYFSPPHAKQTAHIEHTTDTTDDETDATEVVPEIITDSHLRGLKHAISSASHSNKKSKVVKSRLGYYPQILVSGMLFTGVNSRCIHRREFTLWMMVMHNVSYPS